MSSDIEGYTKISQTYKQIVETLTTKQLPQIKLYFTNLSKKIAAGEEKFLSQFKDVKQLLDSVKQAQGKLPIHFAVASGRLEIVSYLIETLKADYQSKDKQGNTPFFTAVQHGHLDIVKYLVENLKVSPLSVKDGEINALHVAANRNNVEMLKYFIEKGCDIQKISIYGKPINWAVGSKSEDAAKFLLLQGADANGDTTCPAPAPIILAVDFQLQQIYAALLNAPKPANLKIKDPQGYSLLHLAAQKGNLKLVQQLIQKGLETNEQVQGKTPLALAFENSKWEVVNYLKTLTKDYEEIVKKLKQQKQKREKSEIAHPVDKQKAQQIKNQGNKYFVENKYEEALQKYKQALLFNHQNDAIHRNLAACYLNLKKYNQALIHCHQAKLSDPKNVKNLYREAQAYIGLGNLIQAASSLWECAMLEPQTIFFRQQFQKYVDLAKSQHQQQK